MPRKELKHPHQITDWLQEWGSQLQEPAAMNRVTSNMPRWPEK